MTKSPQDNNPWPAVSAGWYAVVILLFAYTLAYVDRAVLTILVEPIQKDLGINDTQIALLHGFAFVIFYATLGIPIGYLADRLNRKKLIVVSVAVWSVMTALCGTAKSFGGLFFARIGVGVGEAGLSPASYSLIADYFPPKRRSIALGVYSIGLFLGAGCAIMIGGLVVSLIGEQPTVVVPLLGELRSWQVVFIALGLPGLLASLLAMTFREPPRRQIAQRLSTGLSGFSEQLRAIFAQFKKHRKAYTCLTFGFAFLGVPFNIALLWARPYLTRHFDLGRADAAYLVGGIMVVFSTLGIIAGSYLADKLQASGKSDATIRVGIIASSVVLIPLVLIPFLPTVTAVAIALAVQLFFGAFSFGAAPASLQLLTPGTMRAMVSGFYLLIVNLVGLAMGPTVTGIFTDYVFRDPKAVGYSASIVGTSCALIALCLFLALLKPYRQAVETQNPRG